MGQQPGRKENELTSLMRLKRHMPDFPSGEVLASETPDFLVTADQRRIGIEVTRFYLKSDSKAPIQLFESLQDQVVETAESLHREAGGGPLHVAVSFDDNRPVKKPRVPLLAQELASVVLSNAPDQHAMHAVIRHRLFRERHLAPLSLEFHNVHIWNFPNVTHGVWHVPRAGFVVEPGAQEIQEALDRKRDCYAPCLTKCDEAWLLVVAEGTAPSSFAEFIPSVQDRLFKSPFQRCFLLGSFGPRLHELRIEA